MSWTLLAANDGGHITQLQALADRIDGVGDRLWVTVPTPQTESMLAGERVHWVTPAPTRDWHAAWRNGRRIRHLFHVYDISSAISTGSSVAVSALPHAAHRRIPTHYIESVTRTDGISMSGKMLSRVPGINLYVQWPHLATIAVDVSGLRPRRVLRRGGSEAGHQADGRQPRNIGFVRFPKARRATCRHRAERRRGPVANRLHERFPARYREPGFGSRGRARQRHP